MKKSLFNPLAYLMLSLFVFTSCQDDEIDSIFFRTDGGISTLVTDADGQAISDVKVSLYNIQSENRIDVAYTNESGVVDFGRFEAGEYSILAEIQHNEEYFQINEEVHIISGIDSQHEINIADHYGEMMVRIINNSTGLPIEFNPEAKIGLIPMNDAFNEITNEDGLFDLITYSFDAEGQMTISDLPQSSYLVVMYSDDNILFSNYSYVDPFEKDYVNFSVNPTTLLLLSKDSWVVSDVTADSNVDNIMPISSISFGQNERMVVTYENGATDDAYYYMNSSGGFDWYNLGSNDYNFYFNEDYYEINSDGSITFYFSSWETYSYNDGSYYYSSNVSITLN